MLYLSLCKRLSFDGRDLCAIGKSQKETGSGERAGTNRFAPAKSGEYTDNTEIKQAVINYPARLLMLTLLT